MRIIHCCLANFYTDGFSYQENELVKSHIKMGHDVSVISSTEIYNREGVKVHISPGQYRGAQGENIVRLPYMKILPKSLMVKLRAFNGLRDLLNRLKPDVIVFHGLCGWAIITVTRYVRDNQSVSLYADCHADQNNSAKSWFSKYILHRIYYKLIISYSMASIKKCFYITPEVLFFCKKYYSIPDDKLEYLPLGGNILDDGEFINKRNRARDLHKIKDKDVLLLQAGKIDSKKMLYETLYYFSKVSEPNLKFIIVGSMTSDVYDKVKAIIENDSRIIYLGWVDTQELESLLCATDIYVQPGSQSVTMQRSLCLKCAVILDDVLSHRKMFCNNGWLLSKIDELKVIFTNINQQDVKSMGKRSFGYALEYLDYDMLAKKFID